MGVSQIFARPIPSNIFCVCHRGKLPRLTWVDSIMALTCEYRGLAQRPTPFLALTSGATAYSSLLPQTWLLCDPAGAAA